MDKILKNNINSIYFLSAKNEYTGQNLFESFPISDGNFETNPILLNFISTNGIKLNIGVEKSPSYEAAKDVINMYPNTYFPSATELNFTLLHEIAHSMSNADDAMAYHAAQDEYFCKNEKYVDTNKLLNAVRYKEVATDGKETIFEKRTLSEQKTIFEAPSEVEQKILLRYLKEEIKVDAVAATLLEYAGYAQTDRVQGSRIDSILIAQDISNFVGQDYRKELYNDKSRLAYETDMLCRDMKKEMQAIEQQLGKTAQEYTKELTPKDIKPKSKDREV